MAAAVLRRLGRGACCRSAGSPALRLEVPPRSGWRARARWWWLLWALSTRRSSSGLGPDELAAALAAETEELGIAAGPQDRVVQSHGGLVMMDFAPPWCPWRWSELDPALLPPLFVAWRHDTAAHSGDYHRSCAAGTTRATGSVPALPRAAGGSGKRRAGRAVGGRRREFGRCVDGSFDERRAMGPLEPDHVAMIELARAPGASANYAGSGGAIVGTLPPGASCRGRGCRREAAPCLPLPGNPANTAS